MADKTGERERERERERKNRQYEQTEGTLSEHRVKAYTAAVGDGNLQHVLSRLADVLEVDRSLAPAVNTPVDLQLVIVDAYRHRRRPVGLHLVVLVVKGFQLYVQIRPTSKRQVATFSIILRRHITVTPSPASHVIKPFFQDQDQD